MQPASIAPRDRLIVALDLPGVAAAEAMVARLGDGVTFYKIGYQLAYAGGLSLVAAPGDAARTSSSISSCTTSATRWRAASRASRSSARRFLTVHAYPQTMKAALAGARGIAAEDARGDGDDLLRRR